MLEKAYNPQDVEDRVYAMWEESGAFVANRDSGKEPFTISMPPPNATGQLHLGHAVMLALEDIFIRFHRMRGREVLWVPGTDHAAIATNAVMERKLKEEGTDKHAVGREEFLRRLQEFIEKSRGTIRSQVRKMGSSCDWSRERYTMDSSLNRCVLEVFVRMHDDGLIYRGNRIVNWCPHCQSTLSDDEVVYREEQETFYTIQYGPIHIGTVRPETKFGDTAVAVHPDDERYKKYVGRDIEIETAIGPARIRVIADASVDPKFGTGALKVTPAHDFKDFEMAERHGLDVVQVIDEEGKMMPKAGPFAGMTTRECREAMIGAMKEKGILVKEEPYEHNLSVCYRCRNPVEPLPKLQWFIDVNKAVKTWSGKWKGQSLSLKQVMREVVKSSDIKIIPDRFEKTYFHWIDNLRDWCISRQIWWGHRIPVYYCGKCGEDGGDVEKRSKVQGPRSKAFVSVQPIEKCPDCDGPVEQDPDTLDTWFSSALWTWSTLVDPKLTDDLSLSFEEVLKRSPNFQRFHPTQVMETGYDILFFWIARMILMTTYMVGDIPFETVYLHGMVRTRDGKKMSKSDPETCIDPLEIIPEFGADALRLSMIVGQSPGSDFRLYKEKIAGYRNFVNKLWNASRFVLMQCEQAGVDPTTVTLKKDSPRSLSDLALMASLHDLIQDVTEGLQKYRLSDVGERLYSFVWDYFCDWYLELSKGDPSSSASGGLRRAGANPAMLVHALRTILKLLHPYCPFVTEELWSYIGSGDALLMQQAWPKSYVPPPTYRESQRELQLLIDVISAVRKIRADYGIDPGKKVDAVVVTSTHAKLLESQRAHIERLARTGSLAIETKSEKLEHAASVFLKDIEVHVSLEDLIDVDKEREKLAKQREEIAHFAQGIADKLSDDTFVSKAPAHVVDHERERLKEARETLQKVEDRLESLRNL